jgi:DNA-binding IclR family transcriptional regulator
MHKSTVHRLLATLEAKRFVERDSESGVYRAGIHLLQLAYLAMESNDLRRLAEPFLRQLWEAYPETVDLSIFDGEDVFYTAVIESPHRMKLAAAVGQRLPAYCTASGKSILAHLPISTAVHILEHGMAKSPAFTPHSVAQILESFEKTRDLGYAYSEQEYEEGINAVASAVLARSGQPIAAVAIAGPAFRLTHDRIFEIGPVVRDTARAIALEIEMAQNR